MVLVFRFGESLETTDALRILATRFLPRGIGRQDWHQQFDVWLPVLAPSVDLLRSYRRGTRAMNWKQFASRYRSELVKRKEAVQVIGLLAVLAQRLPIAVGCYCADENECHRSLLRDWIRQGSITGKSTPYALALL